MGDNRDRVFAGFDPGRDLPFSLDEYRERLDRIRVRMEADRIDLLWLSAPESLYYVSGYTCEWYQAQSPKEWPATSGIAVRADSDRFIMFDTPSEALMCRFVTCADDIRIFPMGSRRDGIGFIVDELRAEGWLSGTVGLELHSYRPNPAVSARFRAAFEEGGCRVVDGSDVLREVRWTKSATEIGYLERAAEIADIGLAAARDSIRAGVTELEVYGEIVAAMSRAGGENPGITMPVLSGPKANTGHALSTARVIQPGEQVNVDVCGVVHRYHANGARSFFVGDPPEPVADFAAKSCAVFDVIAEILRPGLTVGELVRTARRHYDEVGIWSDAAWVGGYELGIAFPPDWVGNFVYEMTDTESARAFEPGTIVNFESQFYGPDQAGLTYFIDTLLFTEQRACQPLTTPIELIVVG